MELDASHPPTDGVNTLSVIAELVRVTRDDQAPFVVGVSGMDASGKSFFARSLEMYLATTNNVTIIHLDDFHNPRATRYAGENEAENYLNHSINFAQFEQQVLHPLKQAKSLSFEACLLDLDTDQHTHLVTYKINPGDVVIIEGVFLFRVPWRKYLDLSIFLKVDPAVALRRGIQRDTPHLGGDARRRYEMKYMPAQARHFASENPEGYAHVVIDNSDFEHPIILEARRP